MSEDPIRAKLDVVDDCDLRDALQAVLDLCDTADTGRFLHRYMSNEYVEALRVSHVRAVIAEKLGVQATDA